MVLAMEVFRVLFMVAIFKLIEGYGGSGFTDTIYTESLKTRSNVDAVEPTASKFIETDSYQPDQNFFVGVKRNKDGRLEPLVRSTPNQRIDSTTKPSGIIYFPTPDYPEKSQKNNNLPKRNLLVPRCSANAIANSFCTEVENYPIDKLAKAIEQESNKFEAVFGQDVLPDQPELSQRIDPDFGEEALCQSRERLIFPQAGMTKDNQWSFIVNHENYTQGIRVEECINAGKPCAMAENFPNGYRTECKQKFIYRQLLGMTEQGVIKKDLFQLPSCCKCYIKTR